MNTFIASILVSNPILLAAGRRISRRSSADSGDVLMYLGIAVVVVGGLCAAIYFANRAAQARRFNSHSSLFAGLCKTHDIDKAGRALLKSMAAFHQLEHPARLFCEPQWLAVDHLPNAMKSQK